MHYLVILIIILTGSILMNQISSYFGFPHVVGQLIVGIILGPAALNWLHFTTFINYFFNLGVIILMFIAGLDSNLQLLKRYLRPSIIVATSGVILPMLVMPIIGLIIQLSLAKALFLGVTFSATSVSITVAVLRELNQLHSKTGITILGAAVADDVIAVVLLSSVSIITHRNIGESLIPSQDFLLLIICQVLYFFLIVSLIKILPKIMPRINSLNQIPYQISLVSLIICFTMSYLASAVGLSAITGSFFAGIALNQTSFRHLIHQQVSSLGSLLLIPIFFISIGLNMTLSGIVNHWGLLIILTIAAILTKLYGASLGGQLVGFDKNQSRVIGAGMISRGEVALIIAQIGFTSHLISIDLYSTLISAIIITTTCAPLILKRCINKNNTQ